MTRSTKYNSPCPSHPTFSLSTQARPHDTMAARQLAFILRKVNPDFWTTDTLFAGIRVVDALTHFCDHILAQVTMLLLLLLLLLFFLLFVRQYSCSREAVVLVLRSSKN